MKTFFEVYEKNEVELNELFDLWNDELDQVTLKEFRQFIDESADTFDKCYEFLKAIQKIRSKNNE